MKTGFKNRIEDKTRKSIKSPWNFDCPHYDERSSCYVNAGEHHGVGKNQPVGHKGDTKKEGVPFGKRLGMKIDSASMDNEKIDIVE